jgi:hypothetical protein
MTKEDLSTPITGRHGRSEYQQLVGHVRRNLTSLIRALDERHTASAVQRRYTVLDSALGRAVAYAGRQVRQPHMPSNLPVPPGLDRAAAQAWTTDLWRLRDLRERLRFRALDDPRFSMPATVRVATRAATGPELRGLRVDEHRGTYPPGHGMGIDLAAVHDRVSWADGALPTSTPTHPDGLASATSTERDM